MILGWGKAVKINAAPFVLPTNGRPLPVPSVGVAPHLPPPPPLPFLPMQQMMPRPPPPFEPNQAQLPPPRPPAFSNPELESDSSIEWPDVPFQPKPPPPLPPSFHGDKASTATATAPPARTPAEAAAAAAAIAASIAASMAGTSDSSAPSATTQAIPIAVDTGSPPAFGSFLPPPSAPLIAVAPPMAPFVPAEPPRIEPPRFVEDVPREGDLLIQISVPIDPLKRGLIDLLATYVAADGEAFEKVWPLFSRCAPRHAMSCLSICMHQSCYLHIGKLFRPMRNT